MRGAFTISVNNKLGEGRIRTFEDRSRLIYSQEHLTALLPLHIKKPQPFGRGVYPELAEGLPLHIKKTSAIWPRSLSRACRGTTSPY
jgi:hypothetical protein